MKPLLYLLIATASLFASEHADTVSIGTFDGRTPCHALAEQLNESVPTDCVKIKWRLVLYEDAQTHAPAHYELIGFARERGAPREGKWSITKGTAEDPEATVYKLESVNGKPALYFQKADGNILYFLDAGKKLMVGNYEFSYTLNRVK